MAYDFSNLLDGFFRRTGDGGTATAAPPAGTGTSVPSNYYGTIIGKDAQKRINAGEPWIADRLLLGEGDMRNMAGQSQGQEEARYAEGKGLLTSAYADSQKALNSQIDPNLLFSRASDAVGARSIQSLNNFRQSLGARGLNPNSGVAGGALSRLMFQNDATLTGATRDIAIENQRNRQVAAAQNFANALNLAGYTNAPVSGVGLETEQNIFEGLLAQNGIAENRKSAKEAAKANEKAGWIGAIGGVAGGLAGLL